MLNVLHDHVILIYSSSVDYYLLITYFSPKRLHFQFALDVFNLLLDCSSGYIITMGKEIHNIDFT